MQHGLGTKKYLGEIAMRKHHSLPTVLLRHSTTEAFTAGWTLSSSFDNKFSHDKWSIKEQSVYNHYLPQLRTAVDFHLLMLSGKMEVRMVNTDHDLRTICVEGTAAKLVRVKIQLPSCVHIYATWWYHQMYWKVSNDQPPPPIGGIYLHIQPPVCSVWNLSPNHWALLLRVAIQSSTAGLLLVKRIHVHQWKTQTFLSLWIMSEDLIFFISCF